MNSKVLLLGVSKEFTYYESPNKNHKANDSYKACAETASYTITNENEAQSGQCSEERLQCSTKSNKFEQQILDDLECNECLHLPESDCPKESPIKKRKEEESAEDQNQYIQLLKQYNPVTKTFFKCSIYSPSHRLYTVNEVASMNSEDYSRNSNPSVIKNNQKAKVLISNLNSPLEPNTKRAEDLSPSDCCELEATDVHNISRSLSKSLWCE